jgi:hypothetical protein
MCGIYYTQYITIYGLYGVYSILRYTLYIQYSDPGSALQSIQCYISARSYTGAHVATE